MNKLVKSALMLAALAPFAGCIFTSGDDDDGGATGANMSITWTLVNDGVAAQCPTADAAVTLNSQRPSDAQPFTDTFDCSAGAGSTDPSQPLPAGDYKMWIDITSADGSQTFAESEDFTISLSDGQNASADFNNIDVANGFFDLSWTFNGGANTCADFANDTVDVLSTVSGTTTAYEDKFGMCTDGEAPAIATTDPVAIGDATISVSLLEGSDGGALGVADPVTATIQYGNQYVDLGTIDIPVN